MKPYLMGPKQDFILLIKIHIKKYYIEKPYTSTNTMKCVPNNQIMKYKF